jgi:hypothetical protein
MTRTHYIAADELDWNYAPGPDTNRITGLPCDRVARLYVNQSWYLRDNIAAHVGQPAKVKVVTTPFGEDNQIPGVGGNFKETMNGLLYGHLPGPVYHVAP